MLEVAPGRENCSPARRAHKGGFMGDTAIEQNQAREALLQTLEEENAELRDSLQSLVVVEQAKGILAERYQMPTEDVSLLLRYSARIAGIPLEAVAATVVPN